VNLTVKDQKKICSLPLCTLWHNQMLPFVLQQKAGTAQIQTSLAHSSVICILKRSATWFGAVSYQGLSWYHFAAGSMATNLMFDIDTCHAHKCAPVGLCSRMALIDGINIYSTLKRIDARFYLITVSLQCARVREKTIGTSLQRALGHGKRKRTLPKSSKFSNC
jgi:hypothetical protein